MISCILLSAGLSQRFGSPKALAKLNGETVIEHLQNMLVKTQVDEIIVVLGAFADDIKPLLLKHTKVKFVYNKDYNFGQTSSFKAGLGSVSRNSVSIMLFPVDYPLISVETVNRLIQNFTEQHPLVLIPTYQGKKGHPPLFAGSLKDEFLALDNNTGLNSVAHCHKDQTVFYSVEDSGVVSTFNTQEEFESIKPSK